MISALQTVRRLSTSTLSSKRPAGFVFDQDAEDYLIAVETADGQHLEPPVRNAISAFVWGCKADGNWAHIKSSCLLCAAKTLSGALTPLTGSAPVNNNFVAGDYSRTLGLLGNKTNKWINSGRNNNEDPQDNFHMACYMQAAGTGTAVYMGAGAATNEIGASNFGQAPYPHMFVRCRTGGTTPGTALAGAFFVGVNRSAAGSYVSRIGGIDYTYTQPSETPVNSIIGVFSATGGAIPSDARISFYSIGESISLSALESRLVALQAALIDAIP